MSIYFGYGKGTDVIWGGLKWENMLNERLENPIFLESHGYKVYSQNDEDGIIHEIFDRIGTTNKKFIEFGVQDGLESNCHYLLLKGWSGIWLEGSEKFAKKICLKFNNAIERGQLKVINSFITKKNINDLFTNAGYTGEIDLLSIDIDGNDYYMFEEISAINPRVVVIEYNGKLPPDFEWCMPYNETFIWKMDDYYGASLKSLEILGNLKGYQLVGTNISGVNAFFVRKDLTKNLFVLPATAENLYNPMRINLAHLSGHPSCEWLNNNSNKKPIRSQNLLYFSMIKSAIRIWLARFSRFNRK